MGRSKASGSAILSHTWRQVRDRVPVRPSLDSSSVGHDFLEHLKRRATGLSGACGYRAAQKDRFSANGRRTLAIRRARAGRIYRSR